MITANVALPSFFPHSFATLFGILIIACIEAWFLFRRLEIKPGKSYSLALEANWKSTIAGIPLAWLLWSIGLLPISMGASAAGMASHPAVQSTMLRTVWFGGFTPNEWSQIGQAAATLIMLIPFWLGSVWIEKRSIKTSLPDHDAAEISKAVIRGNLASYSLFLLFGLYALISAISDYPAEKERFKNLKNLREKRE